MKKINKVAIFFLIQLIVIINSMFFSNTIISLIFNVFLILYYLILIKNKSKKELLYLIVALIFSILYSTYLEINLIDIINLIFNYMYFPITLITTMKLIDKEKLNKINIINGSILLANILGIISIILTLVSKQNFNLSIIITLLIPITFTYFNKKNIVNYLITFIPILAILLSKINISMIITTIFIIYMLINSLKEKKKKSTITYLLVITTLSIILTIIDMLSNNQSFISEFFIHKTFFNMIIEIFVYYIAILYITFNIVRKYNKNKNNLIYTTKMIYSSIIIALILGILSSGIFSQPLFVLIYTLLLSLIRNKLKTYDKKIDEDKITILALHLGYGGIEQYLSSLCKMIQDDYKVEIITTYKLQDKPAFEFDKNIKIKYLINKGPNKEELKTAIKEKAFLNILKEGIKTIIILYKKIFYNIEAVENTNSKYIITTRDFQNYIAGEYSRQEIIKIATEHNYHNNNKKYINTLIESVSKTNYFVLVSEELKEFYSNKVSATCLYIPNVIDNLPKKEAKGNSHTLISIGRLSKEKGQIDLIDVVSIIKNKYKDIKLYLIGDGEEKEKLEKYIKKNKLEKYIILTGFLAKKDIELKLLESSVFVTTSHTESFGLVVLEASSYKLPVVAFDSAKGIKALLSDGNGILVSDRNKNKMAKEIIKLFEDKEHYEKIATKGYNNCKKYLAKNVKKDWLELLK